MIAGAFSINPLLWVQFRLAGGWRTALTFAIGYGALAGAIALVTFLGDLGMNAMSVAYGWLVVLTMLQTGLLVLIGTAAVRRAILNDFTSGMMDSHRLTPISGPSAMFGYLIGPNLGLLVIIGLNAIIGLPLCAVGGYSPQDWLVGIVIELAFAWTLWSLAAVAAMATRGTANVVAYLGIGAFIGGWLVVTIVPGLGVLGLGVTAVFLSFLPGGGRLVSLDLAEVAAIMAGQMILAATFFWAGARKYHRPERRAFSIPAAMALLLECAVLGGAGIVLWRLYYTLVRELPRTEVCTQVIATLTALALLALLPVSAAVHARTTWERRRRLEPQRAGRRPVSPILWAIACAGVIVIIVAAFTEMLANIDVSTLSAYGRGRRIPRSWMTFAPTPRHAWWISFAILAVGLIGPALVLWPPYRRKASGAVIVAAWLVLVWVVPPLADLVINTQFVQEPDMRVTWLTGCSPIGALVLLWRVPGVSLIPGLAVQAALTLPLCYLIARPPQPARRPHEAPPPTAMP